ncbi:hypothetical protein [Winogradskyella sp.]|uniref:hypothetical protein n=1 Tax=Winogradskyella sp. TaxID=1883156 RepID=UPI001B0882E0|nr:hypothetical protein [Winogradskyella sp.]MBO6879246.1 hypothetical protein [Winogradskyella sp.]
MHSHNDNIYIGNQPASFDDAEVQGQLVKLNGEDYYKISNCDNMRPFFMSLVSDSNHWMFISSNGGLTAGRKNAEYALFPYYTDDKITESAEVTGSKTILRVHKDGKTYLWEPFSDHYDGIYNVKRNLYKNSYGNKLVFEETNNDLGLTFKYQWSSSNAYGFVKTSTLINNNSEGIEITVLDGLQNIIPYGVGADLQNQYSNLVDAYKNSELQSDSGIGIYALSAIIVDKAEPSEALKANIVWSLGIDNPKILLSSRQLNNFRKGKEIHQEEDVRAEKGAYFISSEIKLEANETRSWNFIANVNQTVSDIQAISVKIKNENQLLEQVQNDIDQGTEKLIAIAGAADGLQLGSDQLRNTRHFANTLFNVMRGGIFDDNYTIEKEDFVKYVAKANKTVANNKVDVLNGLPETFSIHQLKTLAKDDNDSDFKRLCFEYLPLKFSRRHGDPSRPWNKFSINTHSEIDGSKILDYQGNWRDIFQNWEALAHSYPEFIEGMIHKFLNASTFEGYNPYRVTKDGFDWEVIEEDDPWSYIGYWGDHQIIYLLKFLEFSEKHYPKKLANSFDENIFVFANVPYKIKSYEDTLKNPKDTIDFDYELNETIEKSREEIGVDGALLKANNNEIHKVNLIEKLLVTVLAKVSNFIPEGGIWLNTQRPEWNDANNALVGNGVSMVTLYYLQRFLNFFEKVVSSSDMETVAISSELHQFFCTVVETLNENKNILKGAISDKDRKTVLDGLGKAGSHYRLSIYRSGFKNEKEQISKSDLLNFFGITKSYLEHTIKANERSDNLYHAYNLMTVENDTEVSISYLSEMLEGQVAVLSSGFLSSKEALGLLNGLKASALFRPDQYSYILYPNKELSRFVDKNNIPESAVKNSKLLQQLISDGNKQVIEKDVLGNYHFNGNFNNADSLKSAINELPEQYRELAKKEEQQLLETFESVFDHKSFTGRSGTFYGYEGLGSIYWHMVSKLLLAVQENCIKAIENNEDDKIIGGLLDHYYEINQGIGVHKSPELYGAFPTDPYSHTPAGKGAQQPGMTGQVKEDVLCRFGELGVFVEDGIIRFNPSLLRKEEFLNASEVFNYTTVDGKAKSIQLNQGELCFTYCQVPIVYKQDSSTGIEVKWTDGSVTTFQELKLDADTSDNIFKRKGDVKQIIVSLNK